MSSHAAFANPLGIPEVELTIPEFSEGGGSQIGGDLCISNISQAERRKRLAGGVVMFLVSLVILGALLAFGVSRWWRLALLPFFMGASSGFFQWRDKT
jgi:hypothetical protein